MTSWMKCSLKPVITYCHIFVEHNPLLRVVKQLRNQSGWRHVRSEQRIASHPSSPPTHVTFAKTFSGVSLPCGPLTQQNNHACWPCYDQILNCGSHSHNLNPVMSMPQPDWQRPFLIISVCSFQLSAHQSVPHSLSSFIELVNCEEVRPS